MKNQANYAISIMEVFNPNKSPKIIDQLMTTEQLKSEIRTFIELKAAEICGPVDYELAWKTLGLEPVHFFNMISIMGLEDLRAGLESIDSLVTRKGSLMPSDQHFELRVEEGFLSPTANREEYHLEMIKRWCKKLGMDYDRYISTKLYENAPKQRNKKNRTKSAHRQAVARKQTLDNVSQESRAKVLDAMKQPKGTFSFRELMRLK